MYESLKEEIKLHEGYRNKVYLDHLSNRTVGYGHLCLDIEQWDDNKEYTKEELDLVFEKDFDIALNDANKILEGKPVNNVAREVIIEMVFQLGIGGVGKFKNMWKALLREDYGEASFQMLDSLWAKQTPARAGKLAGKMRSAKL
jgi:lysozyme